MTVAPDPEYDFVPPLPATVKKGTQCGQCGAKFEFGKAYGFVCGNSRCPVQLKPTFSMTSTTLCGGVGTAGDR